MSAQKKRCFGNGAGKEFYAAYHDTEWGIPLHDDQRLFEMLILEGAQAGLSWETILKRREGYRQAFHDFDPGKIMLSPFALSLSKGPTNVQKLIPGAIRGFLLRFLILVLSCTPF